MAHESPAPHFHSAPLRSARTAPGSSSRPSLHILTRRASAVREIRCVASAPRLSMLAFVPPRPALPAEPQIADGDGARRDSGVRDVSAAAAGERSATRYCAGVIHLRVRAAAAALGQLWRG